jgi:hypothetical protein
VAIRLVLGGPTIRHAGMEGLCVVMIVTQSTPRFWSCEPDSNRKFNLCSPVYSYLCVYSGEFCCSLIKGFLSHLLIPLSGFHSLSKLGFKRKPIRANAGPPFRR